jgi:hypothetical protein
MGRMAGADETTGEPGGSLRQQLRDEEPVERFKPTSGAFAGWAGILLAAGAVGWVLLFEHSENGLRLGLAAIFAAVVIWLTQIRPRVTAYRRLLKMHGSLRDTYVPYVSIDEVAMGQTLNVWVGRHRYVCVGIGKSMGYEMRQRVRGQGSNSVTGGNRSYGFSGRPGGGATEQRMSYQSFVIERIDDLLAHASRDRPPKSQRPPVRREIARLEVAMLLVTGMALVLSFLV